MEFRTMEDGFEYQMENIFDDMKSDYDEEQESRKEGGDSIQTFPDWLWDNREEFGEKVYTRLDEWCGIDEMTEKYNEN